MLGSGWAWTTETGQRLSSFCLQIRPGCLNQHCHHRQCCRLFAHGCQHTKTNLSTCVANANITVLYIQASPYLPFQGCVLSKLCWFWSYVDMIVLKELKYSYIVQNSIYVRITCHYQNRGQRETIFSVTKYCWSVLTVKHPWGETVLHCWSEAGVTTRQRTRNLWCAYFFGFK